MNPEQRQAYTVMRQRSDELSKIIEEQQSRLESLTQSTDQLQREIELNPVKKEAGIWR